MNAWPEGSWWGALQRWFRAPVPAVRLGAFRALVCAVGLYDMLLYRGVVHSDAALVSAGGALRPWTPIYLFQLLGLGPIDQPTANAVEVVVVAALACGALGLGSRLACAIGAMGFLYWSGLAYSFGKPHHDKVALAFALSVLPFAPVGAALSVDALLRRVSGRARSPDAMVSGLAIRFTQFSLAVGYCGAGSAKILLGGPSWFNGYTLQGIMLGHDGDWSRLFAANVWLCRLQSIGVVSVQVLFPLVLFWPRARWFFLPAATGFHLMTWKTMDTGPYMRLWLLLWAFVPLERVPTALANGLRRGPWTAFGVAVPTVLYGTLVVYVASRALPAWLLAALVAGALGVLLRAWRRPLAPAVGGVGAA